MIGYLSALSSLRGLAWSLTAAAKHSQVVYTRGLFRLRPMSFESVDGAHGEQPRWLPSLQLLASVTMARRGGVPELGVQV